MRMIQSGNRTRFLIKSSAMPAIQPLHGNQAAEASVTRLPYLAHSARAKGREDLIGAEFIAGGEGDRNRSVQCTRSGNAQLLHQVPADMNFQMRNPAAAMTNRLAAIAGASLFFFDDPCS